MKNMKKTNQKGITLIALVVTIIVLIILAGISINLLLGDNGIIAKAQLAGERYKEGANEEQQHLTNVESAIDRIWQGLGLGDNGQGGNPPVISKDTGSLGTPVNADKYGRIVTNYTAKNLVWRLFYEDSNNVYLISETSSGDYPVNGLSSVNYSNSTYSPKNSKYVSGASVSAQGQALMPLASSLFTSSNTNPNIWGVAYLCDTDDDGPWAEYKTGNASWAMGGPIIELFTASYNATHTNHQITLGIDTYGYVENTGFDWFSTSENHGIYRLKSNGVWWLASPSGNNVGYVRSVSDNNGLLGGNLAYNAYSARPVVCIQKSSGFECQFRPEVSVITGAIGAAVNATDYGRIVTNYTAKNLVWRLFYEDSNNVYLISETSSGDYPASGVRLVHCLNNIYSPMNSKYVSGASVSAQGQALMPLASSLFTSSNTNPNIWAVAYLCDTDDDGPWTEYKTGNASWAMGGPTIELFATSYNATHTNHQITLGIGTYGYTHNTGEGLYITRENQGIYRLKNSGTWWLASPGSYDAYHVRNMYDDIGYFTSDNATITRGVRPVVCLQKSNFTYTLAN